MDKSWTALVESAGQMDIISIYQICDFQPSWRSTDPYDWPSHPIIYNTDDFIKREAKILFIDR
ncbi:hypothetical protein BLA29_009904 [Euroglyphus maynei]|uniref:Uncharacterized protein n=1 Tax=Euroglyphus maynei TaxID=6958 RepID=A0A1Y3AVJ6_EURMA|nr:hypothetical protein BLA29_009904 [Euroglyphus maynei]